MNFNELKIIRNNKIHSKKTIVEASTNIAPSDNNVPGNQC